MAIGKYPIFVILIKVLISKCAAQSENITVTFNGDDSYIYSKPRGPLMSTINIFSLQFKTKQDNSTLFYISSDSTNLKELQFLLVTIESGQLSYQLRHGSDIIVNLTHLPCKSSYWTCADNKWHNLVVKVQEKRLQVLIDRNLKVHNKLEPVFSHPIYMKLIFGGQFPRIGIVRPLNHLRNFKGCFRRIQYSGDSVKINIIKEAKAREHFTYSGSQIYFNKCSDFFPTLPISFKENDTNFGPSYVTIPGWSWNQKGQLKFAFRTVKRNSLLMYQNSENYQFDQFDFYAFELREGKLHFSINTGSGVVSRTISQRPVSDNKVHHIKLVFDKGRVEIHLDTEKKLISMNSLSRQYRVLDISGDLYIGGVPESLVSFLPHSVWAGKLRQGFIGCILSVSTGEYGRYDLALRVEGVKTALSRPGHVVPDIGQLDGVAVGCRSEINSDSAQINTKNLCANRPCTDGRCSVGYNQFTCDCTHTNYTGATCNRVAPIVQFNGFQFMKIQMANSGIQTESEDVVLRFLTSRPNGFLLATRNRMSGARDRLEIYLKNGRVHVLMNFGKKNTIIRSPLNCYDGKWHTLKLKRRRLNVMLTVDEDKIRKNLTGSSKLLYSDTIHIGRLTNSQSNSRNVRSQKYAPNHFTGLMMHFILNGLNYFELMERQSPPNIEVTATLGQASIRKEFPVTITHSSAFIQLPRINMYGDFKLDFFIRTSTMSGSVLLLYGASGDFLILEISGGFMVLSFNWGVRYKRQFHKHASINDGEWHRVMLVREKSVKGEFAFRIDGEPRGSSATIPIMRGGMNFNKFQDLYIGSAIKYSNSKDLKKIVRSDKGFVGCIASFYMNQTSSRKGYDRPVVYQNLLDISLKSKGVQEGCNSNYYSNKNHQNRNQYYNVKCKKNSCQAGGRCIQQWTRVRCDCRMTSFIGERCDKVSKTLKFTNQYAYLIYKMYPSMNTSMDELAFGIQTTRSVTSSLIKIEGGTGGDFISAKLVKENNKVALVFGYNMGSGHIRMRENRINFADGYYHRIYFRRHGNNATLQVDNLPPKTHYPRGRPSMHFNQQRSIYVGSGYLPRRYSTHSNTIRGFSGYLSGLFFNRIPLSDMVDNKSYPGIRLLNRSNVYIENQFIPNFKVQPQDNILSEEQINRDRNKSSKNKPIFVAKPRNCSNEPPYRYVQCTEEMSRGIITPVITVKYTPTTPSPKQPNPNNKNSNNQYPASTPNFNTNKDLSTNKKYPSRNKPIKSAATINIWLIIGFSLAGCLLLVIISCFIYRCCRQDEGSYSVEDDRALDPVSMKPLTGGGNSRSHSNKHNNNLYRTSDNNYNGNGHQVGVALINGSSHNSNGGNNRRQSNNNNNSNNDTKEWYV